MSMDASAKTCPPSAPRKPVKINDGQGRVRRDNYRWLHERESKEVKQWLEAENTYTKAEMAATEALQEELYQEMKARLKEDDESLPYSWRGYEFFSRTFSGKDYTVHYRRKLEVDAEEQVIFDGNAKAQGHDYFDLGVMSISPDNRLLGWAEDYEGNESWTLKIKDLGSGEEFADVLEGYHSTKRMLKQHSVLEHEITDSVPSLYPAVVTNPAVTEQLVIHMNHVYLYV